jgi:cyclin A
MALHTKRGHPVTPALRAVLVEWLSSLAPILRFESRTLHLAVLCLDRFLSTARARPAVRSVRVLITITAAALLVASKYEEVYPAEVEEFVDETSRTNGGCSTEELLAAEVAVLKALRHELGSPTACTFLELFMERLGVGDQAAAQLTSRLIELSLLDYGILRFRPSVVAASAILVALMTARPSDDNPWGHEHERATGYTAEELKECAERLNRLQQNSVQYASLSGFENMRKKYSKSNFKCVWTWPPLASI